MTPYNLASVYLFQSDFITGEAEFEDEQLEAAVSGVIFQTIEGVQTVGDAAYEVITGCFKLPH